MAKNLTKRLGKRLATAGVSALAYLPMNSDADIVDVGIVSGNSNVSSSTMKISHKPGGEEGFDSTDRYWDVSSEGPPGNQEQDKFLRVYSNQDSLVYGTSGLEMNRDNRGLDSRESFSLKFDAIAKTSDDEGIFDSGGNYVRFDIGGWNPDGSGIQDYAYDLKIWGDNAPSNPYFIESTGINGGYGVRWLMENNSGRTLGEFDLSGIKALIDGSTISTGGADWGSLALTPSDIVVPEPGTLGLIGVAAAAAGTMTGRKRHSSKKERRGK